MSDWRDAVAHALLVDMHHEIDAEPLRLAVAEATKRGKLRPNSVDSITGENSGNNLGPGTPIIHFDKWESPEIENGVPKELVG